MVADETLVELYSHVGRTTDVEGNIIQEGTDWLIGIEDYVDKIRLARLLHRNAWTAAGMSVEDGGAYLAYLANIKQKFIESCK